MTRDEILVLPAGRELDALAAIAHGKSVEWWWGQYDDPPMFAKFFRRDGPFPEWATEIREEHGYRDMILEPCTYNAERDGYEPLPYYSTNVGDAWKLIEYMQEQDGLYGNDIFIEWWNDDEWFVCNQNLYSRKNELMRPHWVSATAPKPALAITLFFIGWDAKQKEYWREDLP